MRAVKARQAMLLLGDVAILFVSLAITLLIRYGFDSFGSMYDLHLIPMGVIFTLWILIFYVNGLYDLFVAKPTQTFLRRFIESWIVSVVSAVVLFYLVPFFNIAPKTNLVIFSIVSAILIISWRVLGNTLARPDIRVLAINPTPDLRELLTTLDINEQLGYKIVGIVSDAEEKAGAIPVFPTTTPVRALVSEHHANLILIPKHNGETFSKLYSELYELLFWNVYTMPADTFYESLTGRIPLSSLHDSWFFENLRPNRQVFYESAQRIMDIILSILGLIPFAILVPILTIIIKTTSPGPIFYMQERIGRGGKRFMLLKFRTMHVQNNAAPRTTTAHDPRIIPCGTFIRATRLDEIPQIINILRGDMSIIGPRPEQPAFVDEFERHMPYYNVRHLIKPGLSGWAQINHPYAETLEHQMTKFQYDLYYVKNRSLLLDFTIVLKTLHVVLYGKGR